jgi:hypothetical protein
LKGEKAVGSAIKRAERVAGGVIWHDSSATLQALLKLASYIFDGAFGKGAASQTEEKSGQKQCD